MTQPRSEVDNDLIDHAALLPVSRLNRATGDFEVVEGLFEVAGRSDVLVVQTPDGRLWRCRRACPHQGADLAVTGRLGPRPWTIVCTRHRDQGPFAFPELDARPLACRGGWLTPLPAPGAG
jgi:hypothetical protein